MNRFVLATIFLILLSSAIYAQVDMSKLTPKQQSRVKQILAERKCTCGCDMTIAKCLVDDPECETSQKLARKVVDEVIKKTPKIDLKRIDISHLSNEQQVDVYKVLSGNNCTCGCGLTIAKCLVDDPTCEVSPKLAMAVIENIAPGKSVSLPVSSGVKGLKSDQGKWYKEVVGRQLVYIYVGNGYREKEQICLCSNGTFQSSGQGGSISSLGSAAFSDGGRQGNWAVNGDILTLAFSNGSAAKYKLSFYDGFLYLDNTRYFRTENDMCK